MSDTRPAVSPAVQRMLDAQRAAGHAAKGRWDWTLGDTVRADARAILAAQPSEVELRDIARDEAEARRS